MGRDFALKPEDREAVLATPKISPADVEAQILEQERAQMATATMAREDGDVIDRSDRRNFTIRAGARLPEKFINPPCGEEGHLCVDQGGLYRPDWCQLYIHKQHEGQRNPQPFPLGTIWLVGLNKWTDVPPEVIESLRSAVETRHEMDFTPGDVQLGKETEHKQYNIPRFFWEHKKSA